MDFKVVFIAHYQTTARMNGNREKMEINEFDTKWEAEKFIYEWKQSHWFAKVGWVEEKIIDCRTPMKRACDDRLFDNIERRRAQNWGRW